MSSWEVVCVNAETASRGAARRDEVRKCMLRFEMVEGMDEMSSYSSRGRDVTYIRDTDTQRLSRIHRRTC